MGNAPVQTTIHYGDTKVTRWDVEDSADAVDNLRRAVERETGEYAHIRQDTIYSTDDAKRYTESGSKFFSPEAMRFFNSRVGRERLVNGVLYFVTSEKMSDYYNHRTGEHYTYPRQYTVRKFENGSIDEVSEFGEFETSRQANRFLDSIGKTVSV